MRQVIKDGLSSCVSTLCSKQIYINGMWNGESNLRVSLELWVSIGAVALNLVVVNHNPDNYPAARAAPPRDLTQHFIHISTAPH